MTMEKRRTLLVKAPLVAVLALAVGAVLAAGSASARIQFEGDGAVQNNSNGWNLPQQGSCWFNGAAAPSANTRPLCSALQAPAKALNTAMDFGTCISGTLPNVMSWSTSACVDLANTTQIACQNLTASGRVWNPGNGTVAGVCTISLEDDDRNSIACLQAGGTWKTYAYPTSNPAGSDCTTVCWTNAGVETPTGCSTASPCPSGYSCQPASTCTSGFCVGNWIMPSATSYSPALLVGPSTRSFPVNTYPNNPGAGDQCLRCHNSITQYNSVRIRDVEDVLYMGHKNMARKVAAGKAWGGPPMECSIAGATTEEACEAVGGSWNPADPYPSDSSGNAINWATGQITINSNPYDLAWIYGDWLSPLPGVIAKLPASTSYVCGDPRYTCPSSCAGPTCTAPSNPSDCVANGSSCYLNAGAGYSCSRCHTTGWTSDTAIANGTSGQPLKEPEASFLGITWDRNGNAGAGVVNLSSGVVGDANKYSSWDQFGIVCSRCHSSAVNNTGAGAPYGSPTGMSNHHSDMTSPDVSSGAGYCSDSKFTAQAQCDACVCSNPSFTTQPTCEAASETWGANAWLTACSVAGVCSNPAYTTSSSCVCHGGTWTKYDTSAACATPAVWNTSSCSACNNLSGGPYETQQDCLAAPPATCAGGTCQWGPTYAGACNNIAGGPYKTQADCTGAALANCPGGVACQWIAASDIVSCIDAGGRWTGSKTQRGQVITSLCMQCHRQEKQGRPWMDNFDGAGTDSTTHPGSYVKVAQYHETVTFPSHPHGNMFLNSPHGKFTGTFGQIGTGKFNFAMTGEYKSFFLTEGEALNTGNGCTGCHNVHRSTVDGTGSEEAVKPCQECHKGQYAKPLTNIQHVSGPGTPLADISEPSEPCKVCHMPNGVHMFRINPSESYSTFPQSVFTTSAAVNAGTAPDGTFTNAVWVDLDMACGQCHGGGAAHAETTGSIAKGSKTLSVANATGFVTGARITIAGATLSGTQPADWETYVSAASGTTITLVGKAGRTVTNAAVVVGPTKNGAKYRTKAQLAPAAEVMHDGGAVTYPTTFGVVTNGLTVNVYASVTCNGTCSLTYDWDWGDGSAHGTGATASHDYGTTTGAGNKSIKLAVTENGGNVGTATRSVTLYAPVPAPVAGGLGGVGCPSLTFTANTWTASFTDASTPTGAQVIVDWGDGSIDNRRVPAGTFTHKYRSAGPYLIVQKVIDNALQLALAPPCTVKPASFTIDGHVYKSDGVTGLGAATVTIKSATTGATFKSVYTAFDGFFSVGSLKPDDYWLVVSKRGYTFPTPGDPGNPVITVGPNSPGNSIKANP